MLLIKLLAAIALAVAASLCGTRWIDYLYSRKGDILSFPERITGQAVTRRRRMPAIMGALFAFSVLVINCPVWQSGFIMAYLFFLVLFAFTDFEQQVIFDKMLLPCAALGIVSTVLTGQSLLTHILAALGGGGLFLLLALISKGALGGGDIKLIACLGLWTGINDLSDIMIIGTISGGIAALLLLLTGRIKRGENMAYGPYFIFAALYVLFR